MPAPPDLKRLYRDGRILPFVGAGASMNVNWRGLDGRDLRGPSWDELVDQAARMLGVEEPELLRMRGSPLQILEYFRAKKGSFAPLTNWLHFNTKTSRREPPGVGAAHRIGRPQSLLCDVHDEL